MKISVNWLKEYLKFDFTIDELTDKIGAQLGEIEEVVHLGKKYEGIVIVKVVSCEPHPDADRLKICMIDDKKVVSGVARNKDGLVQVVCGAPNARAGMLAAWIPPGITVPVTYNKEPLVLEARKIRGKTSNGMLASEHELELSDDHEGILEINETAKAGQSFAAAYKLDDYIIDIENKMFTHRPDCFGLLGVAREVAGIFNKPFVSPNWYKTDRANNKGVSAKDSIKVVNELPELVPRFMLQVIENVKVADSPAELQMRLQKVGIKPINNIVDITNYMMYLTGQPLHAYDYEKLSRLSKKDPVIAVRKAKKGEKLKVLGGKIVEPHSDAIIIATDIEAIGIGGVIGGASTEVDANTTKIVLECATFDLYSVRKTSMIHGLFTDAVTRFSKGQSPLQNDRVLARAVSEIVHLSGGLPTEHPHDHKNNQHQLKSVDLSEEFINSRLGLDLSERQIANLLQNVEFTVKKSGANLSITAPFWRTDIDIAEDIVEEVGRLYGYDKLPLELPGRKMQPAVIEKEIGYKKFTRQKLASLGANELLNYTFVHGNLIQKSGQDKSQAYKLKNALSPDLQYYRLSLIPSLLEKVRPNLKSGHRDFVIFEIGKVHGKSETDEKGLPVEMGRVGLVLAQDSPDSVASTANFYQAKYWLSQLYPTDSNLTFKAINEVPLLTKHKLAAQMLAPFDITRSAVAFVGEKIVGVVGEFDAVVSKNLKLPPSSAGFEIFLSSLYGHEKISYDQLSKFPPTHQDICLRTKSELSYEQLAEELEHSLLKNSPEDIDCNIRCIDIYQKDNSKKQTTFAVSATSHERTLTSDVLSQILEKVSKQLSKSVGAERV